MISYARQSIDQSDIDAVTKALSSEFLTQGPISDSFENELSEITGANYAAVVNSATSALHLACIALKVSEQSIVWTSPISFVASANCAAYCGARIDFVDVDRLTHNICVNALKNKLECADKIGKLPSVLIIVHFSGLPCDMAPIKKLSKKYGFRIIEDASHAIGAKYLDEPVGNCKYSDITVFSFHPVKIVTSGEGGALLTNDINIIENVRINRSHGVTRIQQNFAAKCFEPWYYEQVDLGYNYRMSDITAALGASQLKRLTPFVNRRLMLANNYDLKLSGMPLSLPVRTAYAKSSWHLYVVCVETENARDVRSKLYAYLLSNGVKCNVHYIPIYKHPYYSAQGYRSEDFPEAERYYDRCLTLPLFYGLEDIDQNSITAIIKEFNFY